MEQQLYQENVRDVRSSVEGRPSRGEDVEEIIRLRELLAKSHRVT
jgi:hypothetical protein